MDTASDSPCIDPNDATIDIMQASSQVCCVISPNENAVSLLIKLPGVQAAHMYM